MVTRRVSCGPCAVKILKIQLFSSFTQWIQQRAACREIVTRRISWGPCDSETFSTGGSQLKSLCKLTWITCAIIVELSFEKLELTFRKLLPGAYHGGRATFKGLPAAWRGTLCLYVCMFVIYIFVCMYVCDVRGPTGSDTRYICIYYLYTYVCDVRGPTGSAAR